MNNQTIAKCPCCGRRSQFTEGGVQRWPEKVAEKHGLPTEIYLWHCDSCHSTVSENNLQFETQLEC